MTLHGGVGLGSRATPVIGINGKHGNETSALGKALFYPTQAPIEKECDEWAECDRDIL
jgi:hypothetical protein